MNFREQLAAIKNARKRTSGPTMFVDLSGKRFNKMTVVQESGLRNSRGRILWDCICDCGNTRRMTFTDLKRVKKPCSCYKIPLSEQKSRQKFYMTWAGMLSRCYNKNDKNYHNYGARGIKVCNKWKNNYWDFHKWASDKWQDGTSLDRINNDGHYSPSNCRYATSKTQSNNTRLTHYFVINGEKKPLSVWCEEYKISHPLVYKRIMAGWDIIKSLTTKSRKSKNERQITIQ